MTKDTPSMTPEDFFKEDFISSPVYRKNPKIDQHLTSVRFEENSNHSPTIKRSHIGTPEEYHAYESQTKKMKEFRSY